MIFYYLIQEAQQEVGEEALLKKFLPVLYINLQICRILILFHETSFVLRKYLIMNSKEQV